MNNNGIAIKEKCDNWDLCPPLGSDFLCCCFFEHWVEFGFPGGKFSGVLKCIGFGWKSMELIKLLNISKPQFPRRWTSDTNDAVTAVAEMN